MGVAVNQATNQARNMEPREWRNGLPIFRKLPDLIVIPTMVRHIDHHPVNVTPFSSVEQSEYRKPYEMSIG